MGCILAVLVFLLSGTFLLYKWEESHNTISTTGFREPEDSEEEGQERTYYKGQWYVPGKNLETVLILGIDKYAENTGMSVHGSYEQADFLLLLVLNEETGGCASLHINRDTMTDIKILDDSGAVLETRTGQITLSHAYGGTSEIRCQNTADAVSNLLYGIEIDHYISFTMESAAVLNDLAGGVTLCVLDDFPGIDEELEKGKTVTLRGEQALTYVRTRKGLEDSSNLHRMVRQRQYLEALGEALSKKLKEDDGFLFSCLAKINPYLVSDCTAEQLSSLAERVNDSSSMEFFTLDGEAKRGKTYVEFYADEENLQELVMKLFYEPVDVKTQ